MGRGKIAAARLRTGRAQLAADQKTLGDMAGASGPAARRMAARQGNAREIFEGLTRSVEPQDRVGIELVSEMTARLTGGPCRCPIRPGPS